MMPVEVEPGSCYLAAATPIRGDARAMRLTARVGAASSWDEAAGAPHSVAVGFCAGTQQIVQLGVHLRGPTAWWLLAVWRLGGAVAGAPSIGGRP